MIFFVPGHIRTSTEASNIAYGGYQATTQQAPIQEPNQHLEYPQYTDQNYVYADNAAEADYSEQQVNDQNQYTYPDQQEQYYSDREQESQQKVIYIYPKSYGEKLSAKSTNSKRLALSTEAPQYGYKVKKQKSSWNLKSNWNHTIYFICCDWVYIFVNNSFWDDSWLIENLIERECVENWYL